MEIYNFHDLNDSSFLNVLRRNQDRAKLDKSMICFSVLAHIYSFICNLHSYILFCYPVYWLNNLMHLIIVLQGRPSQCNSSTYQSPDNHFSIYAFFRLNPIKSSNSFSCSLSLNNNEISLKKTRLHNLDKPRSNLYWSLYLLTLIFKSTFPYTSYTNKHIASNVNINLIYYYDKKFYELFRKWRFVFKSFLWV